VTPFSPDDRLAARHAAELLWHEQHSDLGEEGRINRYKKLVLEHVRQRQWEMLGDLAEKSVLEVGCGAGGDTVELARRGARVLAIDISPSLLSRARERVNAAGYAERVDLRTCPAEALTTGEQRFDVIVGNGILHHLDLLAFKAVLARLMSRDALVQFQEPLVHNPLLRLYRVLTPHLRTPAESPLSQRAIARFVDGFSRVRLEYFNFLGLILFPTPYLLGEKMSRVLFRVSGSYDSRLFGIAPALRKFCQYVVIQFGGPCSAR
jgi:SAM-dependent methyltransferase